MMRVRQIADAVAAQRSTASAILLLIINLIDRGIGPLHVGWVSDAASRAGQADSLQTAMFALAPMFLLTVFAHLMVARALAKDMCKPLVTEGNP